MLAVAPSIALSRRKARRRLRSPLGPMGLAGGIVTLALILVAFLAPVIAPYPPDVSDVSRSLEKPSLSRHLLGADRQGRDVLSRLIYGVRTSLGGALAVVIIATVIGVPLGLAAGYFGGWFDTITTRLLDMVLAFPALLLAMAIVAAFGRGLGPVIGALGVVYIPMMARVVRAVTLSASSMVYVEAANSLGASSGRILFRHILPNVLPIVIVQSTLDLGYAILDLAAFNFLGFGVQPPTADWGAMLAEGREYLLFAPHEAIAAGVVIVIAITAVNLFGDGLRQMLDPRLRRLGR